jgi:hypothetical protein
VTNEDLLIGVAAVVGLCPALVVGVLIGYTYLREKIAAYREAKRRSVARSTLVSFLLTQSLYEIAESLCENNYKESGVQWTVEDLCQRICREEFRRVRDKAPDFVPAKCCHPEPAHAEHAQRNPGDTMVMPMCVLPKDHEGSHLFNVDYPSCVGCMHFPYKPAGNKRCGTDAEVYNCKEVMGGKPTWYRKLED